MRKDERESAIENLCALVKTLFCEVDISNVLHNQVYFDSIGCEEAARLALETQSLFAQCSELECKKRVEAISDAIWSRDRFRMHLVGRGEIHIFELLASLTDYLLVMQNGVVLCRYAEILSWRELIRCMGEEIPVSFFYALYDQMAGRNSRTHFTWNFVAGQNNEALNAILKRGISEYHMHLWPSVPYFQVSWLNLMNNVIDGVYVKNLNEIDRMDWSMRQRGNFQDGTEDPYTAQRGDSLVTLCRQAALIRVYLCERLKGFQLLDMQGQDGQRALSLKLVQSLLTDPGELYIDSSSIQDHIAALKHSRQEYDYMLRMFEGQQLANQEEYAVFSGERWFLYSVFRDIYSARPKLCRVEHNLFYAYLLIMIKLRTKLVQAEQRVGFDYFQRIQRRKSYFLGDAKSKELIMRLAIREPLKRNAYLREMEVRIVPRETAEEMLRDIQELESTCQETDILKQLDGTAQAELEGLHSRYYYVLHFTKQEDRELLRLKNNYMAGRETSLMECRHASYRKKVEKITRALMLFRERYSSMACRVLGIDACSQEIGCRPEVLAGAFRTLGEHTCLREISGQQSAVPRLRKTYHVGEDFLDLTDGLRAIDEAVHFLDLDCGDRLGHALALCLNPIEWYAAKRMQISLSVQDYIDNVVWLYHAIQKYHIPHQEYIIHFLEKEFKYYFNRVYLSNIRENELDSMMCAAVDYYQGDREAYRYRRHTCDFSIELYSYSWMLRGDHPALYQEGYFKKNAFPLDEWESHGINMRYPHNVGIRYIPECSLLYYLYHYNEAVKYAGTEIINIVARPDYIEALTAVQKALQFEIAQRGIAVESNPTSNAKISTFREYSKHPIVALYNKGLFHSEEELRRCAQVQVSINTDDSGVFFTSLESEYAVMARALETIVDHEGNRQFYKWEVYDWLDQVRRMGNEQGFASAALPP